MGLGWKNETGPQNPVAPVLWFIYFAIQEPLQASKLFPVQSQSIDGLIDNPIGSLQRYRYHGSQRPFEATGSKLKMCLA
jgi:hypothetical protein